MDADRPDQNPPQSPSQTPANTPPDAPDDPAGSGREMLERTLRGSLPCIGCGYELQGLSVRSPCPECGLLVRATILYSVDPHADEFMPLTAPRLTAWGIAMWPTMGLLAAAIAWAPRFFDVLAEILGIHRAPPQWLPMLSLIAVAASGVGAIALLKPSRACPRRNVYAAFIGILAYLPIFWIVSLLWRFPTASPYINAPPSADRLVLRLLLEGFLLVMLLGLRPNARRLVARCLALRTGRVQRQTILVTVMAVLLTAVGDALRLASIPVSSETLDLVGMLTVLMGSILMTAAILGATVDSWRIGRAILAPAPTLKGLFDHHDDHHDDPNDLPG